MRPLRRGLLTVLAAAVVAACADEVPPELRPDAVLRDSAGLAEGDVVHTVAVDGTSGRDVARPARVALRAGAHVAFATADGRLHHVRFDTSVMAPGPARWLAEGDRVESPPLLGRDTRWVVDFTDAPAGIYPFRLEGNGDPGGGVVEVGGG